LDDDVFVFDAGSFESLDRAIDEGGDDFGVPASVDDADSKGGAYEYICQRAGSSMLRCVE
jgi:hypothetical protein